MNKQIYINLPVQNVSTSTEFYATLGFTKNDAFSNDDASAMQWSEHITVMLLDHAFYKQFIADKSIADTQKTNGALLTLRLDSKKDVDMFVRTAEQNGGKSFRILSGASEDQMYGYEVLDPDGHQWEPMWMSENFPEA